MSGLARWWFGARRPRGENSLVTASRQEYMTPLARFGPARPLYGRVHLSDSGMYLVVAPSLGADDPVITVGWARNDYWAVRVWGFDGYHFHNDYDPEEIGEVAPSLEALGWPHPLQYAETLERAKRSPAARVMVTVQYRLSDGGFQSHVIDAGPRARFHYEQVNPDPDAVAVAVGLGLGGQRWHQHLAEVRGIT